MQFKIEISGESPLLCNRFTDAAMLKIDGGTSAISSAAGKGTPRERESERLYIDSGGRPVLPGPNLYRAIVDAGRFHKAGKEKITTLKSSLVPAGMWLREIELPIVDGAWEPAVRAVVNPATGGRMIACRPRFDRWLVQFALDVDEKMFSLSMVRTLVDDAGQKIGVGDFRPARKGPFGRFRVTNWVTGEESGRIPACRCLFVWWGRGAGRSNRSIGRFRSRMRSRATPSSRSRSKTCAVRLPSNATPRTSFGRCVRH